MTTLTPCQHSQQLHGHAIFEHYSNANFISFTTVLAIYFLKLNNLLTVIPAVNDYFACPLGAHVEFFLLIIK